MDLGPDGNLYVANAGASEIVVIEPSGTIVRRWGALGSDPGQFRFQPDPTSVDSVLGGVAVGPDGSAYVAETIDFRVQQFDAAGSFVRQWGTFGSGDGEFLLPTDLASRAGRVHVYVIEQTATTFSASAPRGRTSRPSRHGPGPDQLEFRVWAWWSAGMAPS